MEPAPFTRIAMALDQFLKRQSGSAVVLVASALLAVVGALDYVTGWELSVSLLYALIIFLVAWRVNRRTALAFAIVSAVIWCLANFRVHPYSSGWAYGWATFTRFCYFIFVAVGGASLRA